MINDPEQKHANRDEFMEQPSTKTHLSSSALSSSTVAILRFPSCFGAAPFALAVALVPADSDSSGGSVADDAVLGPALVGDADGPGASGAEFVDDDSDLRGVSGEDPDDAIGIVCDEPSASSSRPSGSSCDESAGGELGGS